MEIRLHYAEGHQCYYANTETMIYQADDERKLIYALMEYIKRLEDKDEGNDNDEYMFRDEE